MYDKFWSFNISLMGASLLVNYYPIKMKEQMGRNFSKAMIISRQGHSTCYILSKEREAYGKHQLKAFPDMKGFCRIMKEKTDHMFSVIKNDEFNLDFVKEVHHYLGYYTVPRQVIDFADAATVEKIHADLKEIRLYAEPVCTLIEERIQEFAEKLGSKYYTCMLGEELETYFTTGTLPELETLKQRFDDCSVIYTDAGPEFTDSKEVEKLVEPELGDTVKGMPAFKGKAKGRAKIIFDPSRPNDFKKGDILITSMTRPDFVPIMELAGAIITDIGGLLCHAAIVARELGKPCIIGTKNATKAIKDNDIVEVDADTGEIRKC